jgi:hypothetical protein
VLYRIGTYPKYLTVKTLTIDYVHREDGGAIRCRITISGYMKMAKE